MRLMNLLVNVMHTFASDSGIVVGTSAARPTPISKIVFPVGLPLYDRHLVYIAERCPELKSISFPCAENITGRGITRAMRFWTGMEEIIYGPFSYPPLYDLNLSRTVEEFATNCKNLRRLQLNCFELNWQSADIIVRNLKSVKSLCLGGVNIHKYGLQIFLSRCKKLDILKFVCSILVRRGNGEFVGEMNIMRIQEGRRTRWSTDRFPRETGKLHTSKELVDLLWKR
ncbi:F-box/LRR-repeat protein At3g48880-like isoform X1 [Apium graveolens]|uniref:F-box/LRR-repeat protein At3g48880-like isoform X1 n=1 Tax=Apium graveolens TaxID=4045 RepID=UPI003D79A77E